MSGNYHRCLPALLAPPPHKPHSPHIVADVVTSLVGRGHTVTVKAAGNESFSFVVDGVSVSIRAGSPSDNKWGELWFFVSVEGMDSFARVNAGKVLHNAPFSFVDASGNEVDPIGPLATCWASVWPTRHEGMRTWRDFAERIGSATTVKETKDMLYLDQESFADAVELVLRTD